MKTEKVLGIMSGTSLDGVDYALCEISRNQIKLRGLRSVSYPKKLKGRLMKAATDNLLSFEMAQLHHDLGRFYAEQAPQPKTKFDYIGLHGQTVFHNPKRPQSATLQLGEPAYLGAKFNVPVVSQFRTMDLALQGQGAPLATLFHRRVFGDPRFDVAVNNLGGISNVTFLPAISAGTNRVLSFDTGPANMLVDRAITHFTRGKRSFDKDGDFASRGISRPDLIEHWLKHKFFKTQPPKSTGREEFGEKFFEKTLGDCRKIKLSPEDTVATLTDFSARSIALSYEKFLPRFPSLVILCGGGAQNPALINLIRRALNERRWVTRGNTALPKPIAVTTSDALGWPSQAIEASAFALLAYHTMHELPGNIPTTTGASKAAVLGQVTPAP